MKIAVIGAGWYGCHIASTYLALGLDVTIFEKANSILSGASGNNQFRLHQGFHYARNYRTRTQSRDGYLRFMERYSSLSLPIKNNIYAVPNADSTIDFLTYRMIMSSSGLDYSEISPSQYGIEMCSGALLVNERKLLISKAKDYFIARLGNNLKLSCNASDITNNKDKVLVNGIPFDYVVDATWGALNFLEVDVFFEPTILLYYQSEVDDFALTMVDGALCSIYPCEQKNIYTLSSVPHTPLGNYKSYDQSVSNINSIKKVHIEEKRINMEIQISKYLPNFRENFNFVGPQFSIKTKIPGSTDDRSCYIFKKDRIISVLSGKIDNIFYASDTILSLFENDINLK